MRASAYRFVAALSLSGVVAACQSSPPAGAGGPADLGAVGTPDLVPTADTASFQGAWIFRAGAVLSDSCLSQQVLPPVDLAGKSFDIELAGSDVVTVAFSAPFDCHLDFRVVAPDVAVVVPGQTCRDDAGVDLTALEGRLTEHELEGALTIQLTGAHCGGWLTANSVYHVIGPS